jgi:hypothetical protein
MDDLDPFLPAKLSEAAWDRLEVPQAEASEVRGLPVANVNPMKVAAARVDTFPLPVADDRHGSPVQRARWLPVLCYEHFPDGRVMNGLRLASPPVCHSPRTLNALRSRQQTI